MSACGSFSSSSLRKKILLDKAKLEVKLAKLNGKFSILTDEESSSSFSFKRSRLSESSSSESSSDSRESDN